MPTPQIILLHGIMRSKTDMLPMARYLEKRGYNVLNILYPSRKKPIEDLADFVQGQIMDWADYTPDAPLHFVVHSMGGLIARYYIDKYAPDNLGRVVMLSPPNTGSEFADKLDNHPLFSKPYNAFFGPAGKQLRTDYQHTWSPINYGLGIIAGTKSINPIAFWGLPRATVGAHDGIVPVNRTKIEGMSDFIAMPVNHTFMMMTESVMMQTHHFLKRGVFQHT